MTKSLPSIPVPDSGQWVEKAMAYAKEQRFNVIIEGTMRDHDVVAATMNEFRAAGYEIDARVLAVSFQLSGQGIYQRYEHQKADRGLGCSATARMAGRQSCRATPRPDGDAGGARSRL